MDKSGFFRSTSVRLSMQFAALYTVITACVFLAAYGMADYEISSWVEDQLESEVVALRGIYAAGGVDAIVTQTATFNALNFEDARIFTFTDQDGERLAGNVAEIKIEASETFIPASEVDFEGSVDTEATGYAVRTVALGPNTMIIGTSTHFVAEMLEALAAAFMIGFLAILIIGAGVGVFVGRRTETRLAGVSAALAGVSAGQIKTRVPVVARGGDDLSRVSREVNATLEHVQRLLESQQQISADIAHDLKTPLQRLRQRLERIAVSPDMPNALIEDVDKSIAAIDDLIETFQALLRISQIEAGARRERFAVVDLVEIMSRIEDAYSAVAEGKDQMLQFQVPDGPLTVNGDRELLTQMLANTVENALRHCNAGAAITVSIARRDTGVLICVADNGPGIPAPEYDKVFRRFYRLEKSRTTSGNGLGLSLIKAIAQLHEGHVSLSDNHPGLRVEIELP